MRVLSLNSRGLSSDSAVRKLQDLQRRHKPDILFLSETHLDRSSGERLKLKMGFANMYVANSTGRGGGLLMFSAQHVRLSLKYIHNNYIDVLVMGDDPNKDWRLTGLYGESVWRHKHRTWGWLRDLHAQAQHP
jgi:exonuclease III